MAWLTVLKVVVLTLCISACALEIYIVLKKVIAQETFQSINELSFDELLSPTLTLCPGPAWKAPGPFVNEEQFARSTYSKEEIFHPKTLEAFKNESLFIFKEQYASYYGLCFVIQKLTPEKVSDYSFQIVVNDTIDYNYYLHEPLENEWLFMSVYPYEVPVQFFNVNNDDGAGGGDIIYKKEITKKMPGEGKCESKPMSDFVQCIKDKYTERLRKANIPCKVPALRFTSYNTDLMEYCTTKEQALEIDGILYNEAIANLADKSCINICDKPSYPNKLSYLGKNVLSKELKIYGDGYYIIWNFYTTLYVEEKEERLVFDFNSALVAIGGTLGLFLGWSIASMVLSLAEFLKNYMSNRRDLKTPVRPFQNDNKENQHQARMIHSVFKTREYVSNMMHRMPE